MWVMWSKALTAQIETWLKIYVYYVLCTIELSYLSLSLQYLTLNFLNSMEIKANIEWFAIFWTDGSE